MKRWAAIAVAIAAATSGCSSVAKAPTARSPIVSYSPAPSAASLVSLSGKNSYRTDPISIPAGTYRAAWTVDDPEGSLYLLIGLIHGADTQPQNKRTWLINAKMR